MKLTFDTINLSDTPYSLKKIRSVLNRYIKKVSHAEGWVGLDPFARESFTNSIPNFITNDLNPEFKCDFNLEFLDYCKTVVPELERPIDIVLFDPPYNLTLLKKHYDGIGKDLKRWQTHSMWGEGLDIIANQMKPGGYFISLGYSSRGMGKKRGFKKIELINFECVAREGQYNLQLVVEEKIQTNLFDF